MHKLRSRNDEEDLIRENSESIDEHAQELGKEAMDDLANKIKSNLKKAFKGNKNIKLK